MINNNYNCKYLLWKKDIVYNHPAMRQYYMARNQIYVARKYPEEFSMYKQLKKELKKEKNFFKITKTNKRSNINIISCNNCSTSYFSKCNNKHSI